MKIITLDCKGNFMFEHAAQANEKNWTQYQAVYVHIPFCRQKCLYCDFASYAGFSEEAMTQYADAVCREIAARIDEAGNAAAGATIYFGGGTPSVLPLPALEKIVSALKSCGFWKQPAEATIEVNPGTADLKKLRALRRLGFDRISFGVQSLQDDELRVIGRIHTAAQALDAIAAARAAGFKRISCDVIYGLPGQSLASLRATLLRLTAAGIEHLSVYGLIVEEGTPLAHLVDAGALVLPAEDTAADMYDLVQELLTAQGFDRYEISNYAKNAQYSRHNIVYWQYRPYLAFGAAACGFDGRARRTAARSVEQYVQGAQALTPANWRSSSLYAVEEISAAAQLGEFMFMNLRRAAGADLQEARLRFAVDVQEKFGGALQPFLEQGLVQYNAAGTRLRLTPRGMAVGNRIFAVFLEE